MKKYKYVPGKPGVTLFQAVYDLDNLRLAHKNASKNKRWYKEVEMVNKDPDKYLKRIRFMLRSQTYHNSKYEIFERQEHDKVRTIYKLPYYPDRIIQWALLQVIAPILENTFIKDTYSAIPGRGPIQCMLNVANAIHNDPEGTMYCLKIDIHHFYQSINHDILKEKYLNLFKDYELLWLIYEIIDSVSECEGIPIGNYTSQYSGNLYLSEFDHWIKEVKHIKYYYRYMDDMVFLADDKDTLHDLLNDIIQRLNTKEKLSIKDNYQIFITNERGLDYVGYVIFSDFILIRNRMRDSFIGLCKALIKKDELSDHDISSLFSYIGFLQHSDSYNLQMKYYQPIKIKFNLPNVIKTITSQNTNKS